MNRHLGSDHQKRKKPSKVRKHLLTNSSSSFKSEHGLTDSEIRLKEEPDAEFIKKLNIDPRMLRGKSL